jgi:hypothetical protein
VSSQNIWQPTRADLYRVFRDDQTVKVVEAILKAINETLPANTVAVEAALAAHIADAIDAHQASAIGNTPAGSIAANTVQGALNELDAEKADAAATTTALAGKQPLDGTLTALAALVTAADRLLYATGADTFALTAFTAFARTILDDPDAGTALNTLGVASAVSTWLSSPTSANLRNALSDETGSGAAVFGTSPTISAPILTGTTYSEQGAPTTKAGAATLTIAELLTGIIEYTGAAAALTLPTGANIDAGILASLAADRAFEFCVINTGSGTATVSTAAGLSLVGTMTVAAGVSALFRARKTAADTFTVYRLA